MAETLPVYRIVRFAALRSHITRQKWPKSSLDNLDGDPANLDEHWPTDLTTAKAFLAEVGYTEASAEQPKWPSEP